MVLFRVFAWDGASQGDGNGGPLFVPRGRQGAGRHDVPSLFGALYCSRDAISAIAESVKHLRGRTLTDLDFAVPPTFAKTLVELRLDDRAPHVVDLDEPTDLLARALRPSRVATRRRPVTQRMAAAIFDEGAAGLQWWSTLDAEWTNVTLFYERAATHVRVVTPPRKLTTEMLELRQAAHHLGISIAR